MANGIIVDLGHSSIYIIQYEDDGTVRIEKCSPGCNSDNVYQLRRLYCKHPSNDNFRRTIAIITGIIIKM